MTDPQPALAARNFVARRRARPDGELPRTLIAVAEAVEQITGSKLTHAGWPPRPIALSEPALTGYVASVRRALRAGRPEIVSLADDPKNPDLAVVFQDAVDRPGEQLLRMAWPEHGPLLHADAAIRLTGALCRAYEADAAAVEDERLVALYRGARVAARVLAGVPAHLRKFVPPPLEVPGAAGTLPELLLPTEIDRRIPDAVFWVNFWTAPALDAIGRARVLGAGWARIVEQPDGALVLVATETPTDPSDPVHLEALRSTVERLGLRDVQERHRR